MKKVKERGERYGRSDFLIYAKYNIYLYFIDQSIKEKKKEIKIIKNIKEKYTILWSKKSKMYDVHTVF